MYSGAMAATIGRHDRGVATVTSPAPDRSAPTAARCAAPVQLEVLPVHLVEERQRNPDVRDHEIARVRVRRRKDQRDLRRRERHRHRGLDGGSVDGGAVGRETRGQVDRDNRHAQAVQVGDDGLEKPGERTAEAGAEDRVDDEIAVRELARVQLPLLRARDLDHGHADAAEHLEVRARVAADLGHAPQQKDGGVDAALHERARDHEPVAAVVATAADDAHAARREVVERRLHRGHRLASGILHEHDRRDPDVLYRAAIGLAHLFGIEHSHATVERTACARLRQSALSSQLSEKAAEPQNLIADG
jgi:hypothetical protein